MSEKPSFNEAEYLFMSPGFVMGNKDGKPVFSMKRKEPERPDGTTELYYIFQIHEENLPDDTDKGKFMEVLNEFIFPMAGMMEIGMFSFDEISERATEQVKKIYESGKKLTEEQIDVKIEVFNYATKELGTLVVGVNTKPIEDIENLDIPEDWKKRARDA